MTTAQTVHPALIAMDPPPPSALLRRTLPVLDDYAEAPDGAAVRRWIEESDALLRRNPSWAAPHVDPTTGRVLSGNPVSTQIYADPVLAQWARTMTRASALEPLYFPDSAALQVPDGDSGTGHRAVEMTPTARDYFRYGQDASAIRTRRAVVEAVVREHAPVLTHGSWTSLACGAGVPVLAARQGIGARAHVHFVDIDRHALGAAAHRAENVHGMVPGEDFTVRHENLLRALVLGDGLLEALGEESQQLVDLIGIFEYFPDEHAVRLLRQAFRLVRPGGVLLLANMLSDRPLLAFHQRGVGWPNVIPRSQADLGRLLEQAGLHGTAQSLTTAPDGVYGVIDLCKV